MINCLRIFYQPLNHSSIHLAIMQFKIFKLAALAVCAALIGVSSAAPAAITTAISIPTLSNFTSDVSVPIPASSASHISVIEPRGGKWVREYCVTIPRRWPKKDKKKCYYRWVHECDSFWYCKRDVDSQSEPEPMPWDKVCYEESNGEKVCIERPLGGDGDFGLGLGSLPFVPANSTVTVVLDPSHVDIAYRKWECVRNPEYEQGQNDPFTCKKSWVHEWSFGVSGSDDGVAAQAKPDPKWRCVEENGAEKCSQMF